MNIKTYAALAACLIVNLLIVNTAFASKVYKWTDEAGNTHFSQFPPAEKNKAEQVNVKTTQGNAQAGKEKLKNLRKQLSQDIEARNQRKLDAEAQKKKDERDAENCKTAEGNYHLAKEGGRVYKMDENGNRKYYSNEELADRVKEAKKAVDKYCK